MPLFDKIIVAIGVNGTKKYLFDLDKRLSMLETAFKDHSTIEIQSYEGLTMDFCKKNGANHIIRGLRNSVDFEYEKSIAQMNKEVSGGIETVMLVTDPASTAISSSIIRDLIRNNGDVAQFLPPNVKL